MNGVLVERSNLDTEADTHIQGRRCEETQGEDKHLEAKERALEQIRPSQPTEGSNPTDTAPFDTSLQTERQRMSVT